MVHRHLSVRSSVSSALEQPATVAAAVHPSSSREAPCSKQIRHPLFQEIINQYVRRINRYVLLFSCTGIATWPRSHTRIYTELTGMNNKTAAFISLVFEMLVIIKYAGDPRGDGNTKMETLACYRRRGFVGNVRPGSLA